MFLSVLGLNYQFVGHQAADNWPDMGHVTPVQQRVMASLEKHVEFFISDASGKAEHTLLKSWEEELKNPTIVSQWR